MSDFNLIPLLPEVFLTIITLGMLMVGAFQGNKTTPIITYASITGLILTGLLVLSLRWERYEILGDMIVVDALGGFFKILIVFGLILSMLLSIRYLQQENMERFEFPILVLLSGIGMMLMVSASHMLSLYMALELQSLSLYVLAAFRKNSLRSSEAGIKYFILGALSSGMLLFGISLLYGYTGALSFVDIGNSLRGMEQLPPGFVVGMVFVLTGIAFKISAVPFHMWTPDVYQGAATNVTALFAIAPKIAALGLLIRLLHEPFALAGNEWIQIMYVLSLGSMLVGSFAGIAQTNIKRLMAYSSIGNMGYLLIGLVIGTAEGVSASIFYLVIYIVMVAGVFAILLSMRRNELSLSSIEDLSGLSQTNPKMAYALAILLLSIAGIPFFAGFFGKLVVFNAAIEAEFYVLAILGILTSVVAAFYYLRIVKTMFFDEPIAAFDSEIPFARKAVMYLALVVAIGFILKPNALLETTRGIAATLF